MIRCSMIIMKINFYNRSIIQFIEDLERNTIPKVLKDINMLSSFGRDLCMPHSKYLGKNLFELRTRGRQEIRIFYCFYNGEVLLLHAFIKKSQKIPAKELEIASSRFKSLCQ